MDGMKNGQKLLDVAIQFVKEHHLIFQEADHEPVIRIGYRSDHGTWVCFLRVEESQRRLIFISNMGLNVGPQYRAAVMEYLTRVNFGLDFGNFDMNVSTGQVRFRTCVDVPGSFLSEAILQRTIFGNLAEMERYFPGVLAIVHSGFSPEAALARIELQIADN